jgi:hypothetical protein
VRVYRNPWNRLAEYMGSVPAVTTASKTLCVAVKGETPEAKEKKKSNEGECEKKEGEG